jgi:MYXO-CTERM domain-containing protein
MEEDIPSRGVLADLLGCQSDDALILGWAGLGGANAMRRRVPKACGARAKRGGRDSHKG